MPILIAPGQPVPDVRSMKTLNLRHLGEDGVIRDVEVEVAKHTEASKAAREHRRLAMHLDATREREAAQPIQGIEVSRPHKKTKRTK